jgi:hypothetical protein
MRLLKSYFFWSHERGSFHFDVMVTLILVFVFVSPRFINFQDRPVSVVPLHASEVLVKETGTAGEGARFVYDVRAEDVKGAKGDAEIRAALLRVIEPISGDVTLTGYTPLLDAKGHVQAYEATAVR